MANRIKYKKPPLVEAVFELFYESKNWSTVIPGVFYNEVKDRFPKISQNQGGFGISFDNKQIRIGGGNPDLVQYRNNGGDSIIQLSPNLLTVNKLPVYKGWEYFMENIQFAIRALENVLDVEKVNRIGLKTLNKIDIKDESLESFKKHFNIYPSYPNSVVKRLSSIQMNLESPIVEGSEYLGLSIETIRKEPNFVAPVLFQIYVTKVNGIEKDSIGTWLESAHTILNNSFEESLTEEIKGEFEHV